MASRKRRKAGRRDRRDGPAGQLIGPVAAARDVTDDADRTLCRRQGGAQGVPGFRLDAGSLVDDGGPDVLAGS